MRPSSIVRASFAALAALAITADGAFAATNLNSSRSNNYKIGTTAGTTVADCIRQGGTVTTNRDRTKTCTFPASINLNSSKSNAY